MSYKVGQKVVCVDDSAGKITGLKELIKGEIYTIRELFMHRGNCVLRLEEIILPQTPLGNEYAYSIARFRPLDHEFADKIEAMIKKSLKTEELCK